MSQTNLLVPLSVSTSLSAHSKFISALTLQEYFEVYSVDSGRRVRSFAHRGKVCSASSRFLDNDKYLVCGSEMAEVEIWEMRTGQKVQTLHHLGKELAQRQSCGALIVEL